MPLRREPDSVSPRALAKLREGGRHRPIEVPRGPVFEVPLSLQGARWMPSRSAVVAVLGVVAVVAVVFGARVWLAGAGEGTTLGSGAGASAGGPAGVIRGTSTLSRASPGSSTSPSAAAGASASPGAAAAGLLVVHVVGQVAKAGVYRLRAGSRVGDAVTAAGGATRAADLAAVNLARVLVDGEQVIVPKPGEVVAAPGGGGSGSSGGGGGGGSSGSSGGVGGSASPGAAAAGLLVVHVVGQVAKAGVYRLRAGSRVGDAVTAAGGATRGADLAAVNLARVLVDGEQIIVPKPGEVVAAPGAAGSGAGSGQAGGGGGAGSGGSGGKVSLNSADLSALDTLPGVGPVLAQRILDWRTEHGRFTTVDELGEVSGIGEKLLAQLSPKVTL